MSQEKMNILDFCEHVDLYSADLSRWPQEVIKPALALMQENTDAKSYFDQALALDDHLRMGLPCLPDVSALHASIMKEIQGLAQQSEQAPLFVAEKIDDISVQHLPPQALVAPGGGLMALAVIGFLLGFNPAAQADYLVDPAYYAQEEIISADQDVYGGEAL